ncbi:MAG: 6-bladed beta-propeller [Gemmatimonadetes bacterium]|nr:6-bladed beta-propeller [Gemmatimonadota bacterium]MCA9763997.1 6-bladed beta-propeller [Gemmatimonadota bacterium]MCB9519135.1 6-bladed beta-propeller [Gemmatimonadales bacterium]HPF60943.1 6-bladed beta-propeller [Gemmatimonadales bacterium]HRX17794.1 6-bladed beta-propeller [Gemmatimonadales bacterium]
MPSSRLPLALLTVIGAVPAAAQVRTWTPAVDTVGTALRVTSPGYTAWRDTTTGWILRLEQEIDLAGSEPWSPRAQRRTLLLPDGGVAVSTVEPAKVEIYDRDGRFVRLIGRAGGGTGEYLMPSALAITGDTLVVNDARQGRVLLYSLSGRFLNSFFTDIRGTDPSMALDPRGLLRLGEAAGAAGEGKRWVYFTLRGERRDSLERPPLEPAPAWDLEIGPRMRSRFVIPFSPMPREAFLPDGSLVYGRGDRWQFLVTRSGDDTLRIMELANTRVDSVPPAYADTLVRDLVASQPLLAGVATREAIPRIFPAWNDVAVDGRGFLWVSVGYFFRRTHYFAVFHPDGRYLGYVPSWFERFEGTSWREDRVAVPAVGRDRQSIVRIYRIDRRGEGSP